MPEPASAALRRLHEEATPGPSPCNLSYDEHDDEWTCATHNYVGRRICSVTTEFNDRVGRALTLARNTAFNALPALADLVAAVESELGLGPALPGKPLSDALAALREQLGAKP